MEFKRSKCEVSLWELECIINGKNFHRIDVWRNPGVHSSLKMQLQVVWVVKKAYGIARSIKYKSQELMIQHYRSLVRLHLEYWVQFGLPHYR